MNTDQLQDVMEQAVGQLFVGVFPKDKLPIDLRKPACLIANLDLSYKSGTHWVAYYFDIDGHGEYFCSYGLEPKGVMYDFLYRNSTLS